MFVKGHKKFGGWASESKEKRKKVHEFLMKFLKKLAARKDLPSGLTQAMITTGTLLR
ncbi:hypothetical protein AGMMS50233_10370 [Endomicrobiia bacterium]|nr:hypothetical protein AGMMS50233_10370 [Endomicrobiia bacterium]